MKGTHKYVSICSTTLRASLEGVSAHASRIPHLVEQLDDLRRACVRHLGKRIFGIDDADNVGTAPALFSSSLTRITGIGRSKVKLNLEVIEASVPTAHFRPKLARFSLTRRVDGSLTS